jgi:hypothetical protein
MLPEPPDETQRAFRAAFLGLILGALIALAGRFSSGKSRRQS